MTHYFEATEERPDLSITAGTIDSAGYRVVWLKAAGTGDVHRFLRSLGVHPDRVRPLAPGHTPALGAGLDFDLTSPQIDRTVNTSVESAKQHTCHAFHPEIKAGELVLLCKQCGAILHDNPRPRGGYYDN